MKSIIFQYGLIGKNIDLMENIELILDENHSIIEINETSRKIKNELLVVPGLFNAHVHAADIGLRGIKASSLSDLVGPEGIKQNYLSSLSPMDLTQALSDSYEEAILSGTLGWADFREGAIKGLEPYPLNNSKWHIPFGRSNIDEIDNFPAFAHIGFRDVNAYTKEEIVEIARIGKRNGKILFIHASEDLDLRNHWIIEYNESDIIWSINYLDVDAIIHLTHATSDDIEFMEKKNVGGIICLSSNLFTSAGTPPINDLIHSSLTLGIGTDNAMFSSLSLWEEMHLLSKIIEPKRLFKMATIDGAKLAGISWGIIKNRGNIVSLKIPNSISRKEIYKWLVSSCNNSNITQIWSLI